MRNWIIWFVEGKVAKFFLQFSYFYSSSSPLISAFVLRFNGLSIWIPRFTSKLLFYQLNHSSFAKQPLKLRLLSEPYMSLNLHQACINRALDIYNEAYKINKYKKA